MNERTRPDPVIAAAGPRLLRELTRPWAPAAGATIVAGVSGGADSTGLLRLLAGLAPGRGWTIVAASLDHRMRGSAGADDARFVVGLGRRLGIHVETATLGRPPGSEAEARRERRAFLERVASRHGAAAIALAHTMDDQAETVLGRLARGAGLAGASAMRRWSPPWWRPLLGARRSRLRELLDRIGQPWREDETNLDPTQLRARLRARVIPVLEGAAGPGAVPALARAASLAAEDNLLLEELAAERVAETVTEAGPGRIACSLRALRALPRPLARRLFRRLVAAVTVGAVRPDSDHVEALLALLDPRRPGSSVDLPRGLRVRRSAGLILIEQGAAGAARPGETPPR